MSSACPMASVEDIQTEPFEDRVDILFRELELAAKWQRPSVLLAVYSSEYVREDADIALDNRLHQLGQSAYHIKVKNPASADVSTQISKLTDLENVVFFVEGLRCGAEGDASKVYQTLNNRREFFVDHQVRCVFWLTEQEAIDLAHFAPDYWTFRHRVIEFVDQPKEDRVPLRIAESTWQGSEEAIDSAEDLDAKIELRTALLSDLPAGSESTSARANLLLTLGMLHWRKGDLDEASHLLNKALELAATLEDACFEALCFNAIALVLTGQGRVEEAIQSYKNAIQLAPEQISPWNNLGLLYKRLGRKEEALEAFQKTVDQNGSDAIGWNGLGDLYQETGKVDEAIYAYLKAIEFAPDYAPSWSNLGSCYLAKEQVEDALAAFQQATRLDRRLVNPWLGLGKVYTLKESHDNATMAYRTALEFDPANSQALNELGNLYYSAGSYDEAMRCLRKGLESSHPDTKALDNLASIYVHKGMHSDAIPLLKKVVEARKNEGEIAPVLNRLGDAYRAIDDQEHAIEAYMQAGSMPTENAGQAIEQVQPEKEEAIENEVETPEKELITGVDDEDSLEEQPAEKEVEVDAVEVKEESETPVDEDEIPEEKDFDPDEIKEEPLPEEPVYQGSYDFSNELTFGDYQVLDESQPRPGFKTWLDGLASFMSTFHDSLRRNEKAAEDANPVVKEEEAPKEWEDCVPNYSAGSSGLAEPYFQIKLEDLEAEVEKSDDGDCEPEPESTETATIEPAENKPLLSETPEGDKEEPPVHDLEAAPSIVEATPNSDANPEGEQSQRQSAPVHESSLEEKNAQIWNELGNIYYNSGSFDEAMHAFEMAIELDPSYGWSYNNLASIYFHQKRYSDAIPLYQKGLQFLGDLKDKAVLWNRLGDAYRRIDDHDQAAAAYRKAIELDPDNVSLLTRARFSLLGNLRI